MPGLGAVETPSMHVALPPEIERLIEEQIRLVRFGSAAEVVREGLRLLVARQADHEARLAELDAAIGVALDQAGRGELLDGEGSRARVEAALAARGVDIRPH
jgi:antitoxin ParD1/3/4